MIRLPMANIIPPETMLDFYRRGVFPMAVDGELRLFSPDPRGVIPLDGFRIPHGSRKILRDPAWEVSVNEAFEEIVLGCAERDETWIDETIFLTYGELHHLGHAHSVEVWREGELAGGLYGVAIGAAFFGESMFSRLPGASKVAPSGYAGYNRSLGQTRSQADLLIAATAAAHQAILATRNTRDFENLNIPLFNPFLP